MQACLLPVHWWCAAPAPTALLHCIDPLYLGLPPLLQALSKSGSLLGDFPIRVSPSKTAIVPVNNTYLPRSSEERELVARTVFVGNIDRVVEREQLREFFENLCGECGRCSGLASVGLGSGCTALSLVAMQPGACFQAADSATAMGGKGCEGHLRLQPGVCWLQGQLHWQLAP